jgi:hypothetical protein
MGKKLNHKLQTSSQDPISSANSASLKSFFTFSDERKTGPTFLLKYNLRLFRAVAKNSSMFSAELHSSQLAINVRKLL